MTSSRNQRKRIAVLGAGAMGAHHVRVLSGASNFFELVGIFDTDFSRAEHVAQKFGTKAWTSRQALCEAAQVAVIAAPTLSHAQLAVEAMEAGADVFVEKPLAASSAQAAHVVAQADRLKRAVYVGHTERFNPVVRWLHERVADDKVLSIHVERIGPRPPRIKDVGVITDIAVHDLDIIQHLSNSTIDRISCVARATDQGVHEDVAQIVVGTENNVVGSINTNWLTPFKSRRILIATQNHFYTADLMRFSGFIYSCASPNNLNQYNVEEAPIQWREPLEAQCEALYRALTGKTSEHLVDGKTAAQVVGLVDRCLAKAAAEEAR